MKRRILSWLLVFCMTISTIYIIPYSASAATNGTCGDNLTWELTDEGELIISGTGEMTYWSSSSSVPWHNYRTSINTVTINKGVESIENFAFHSCSNLTSVTIPNSITSIGSSAFFRCSSFTSVTIPDSVESIGEDTFGNCNELVSINVNSGNEYFTSNNGVLFNKNKTKLLCCPGGIRGSYSIPNSVTSIGRYAFYGCSNLTSVTIPSSVIGIGSYAFSYCSSLTNVTISNGATSIGGSTFCYCDSLELITIPNSIKNIGAKAFESCSSLEHVYYDGTRTQWSSITVGSRNSCLTDATIHCLQEETNLTIPTQKPTVTPKPMTTPKPTAIPNPTATPKPTATTKPTATPKPKPTVTLRPTAKPTQKPTVAPRPTAKPTQKPTVTPRPTAKPTPKPTATATPNGVVASGSCGDNVAWTLDKNGVLTISGSGMIETTFNEYSSKIKSVVINNGVTGITNGAFSYCQEINDVKIPDSVTFIGMAAFAGCSSLTSIEIPSSVTALYGNEFADCSNLTTVKVYKTLTIIPWNTFENCVKLKDVYYNGSSDEWYAITKGAAKGLSTYTHDVAMYLWNANVHYPNDAINNDMTTAGIEIGEYIQMGTYYGESILWRCVDIDENGPLILSDKIICLKPFDAPGTNTSGSHGRGDFGGSYRRQYGSNYWADSNLRCWLNSSDSATNIQWACGNPPTADKVNNSYADEDGFKTNFSLYELNTVKEVTQKSLLDKYEYSDRKETPIIYDDNPYYIKNYDDAYSEQVVDGFFLLDLKQISQVYKNGDILGKEYYIGEPTKQCISNSQCNDDLLSINKKWHYWLRSPYTEATLNTSAPHSDAIRIVSSDGRIQLSANTGHYGGSYPLGYNVGVRPAFYLNLSSAIFKSGNGTEMNPYTVEGSGTMQQACFTLPATLTVSLEGFPQMLYARGRADVTFTCDNDNVVELAPSNQKDIFETAAVSGVYVKGLTPGTATITATAPDGTSAQCLVTVEGKMVETIDDELILKAKICANNHSYKYMRDCWKSPSTVITENADLGTSKIYQGINDFIDACNLDYSVKNYYEIALMDMLNNKNIYYEVAKDATNNPFLKQAFSEANKKLKENANANKVTISGLNYFDVDKFYNDLTFLDGILLAGDVSSSMYEKYEQIYQLTLVTDKQIKALEAIKASTLNDDLKQACDTVIKSQAHAAQVTANEIAANTVFAGVEELGDFVVQRGWDELTNLIPGMAPAKAIVSAGKLVSNGIYNADKLSTDMLTMAATAEIEASLQETMKIYENKFLKNQTIDNALNFMATADFCKQIGVYGCDAAIEYAEDIEYSANIQEAINKTSEIIPSMALKTLADLNKIVGKCDTENITEFKRLAESIKRMTANYDFYDPCGDDIASYIRDVVSTTPSEWAKPYVDKAISYKLLDTEYQNNYQNNITRAEFCTLLTYLIENKSDISIEELAERAGRPAITVEFDDTMYVFVSEIAKLGIINGVGDNKFEPLGNITREQAAKMLCETARILGYDISAPQTDLSGVSDWAKEGVNFVINRGIMTGTNNGFEPQGTYTKEQAITTMVRFFENLK